MPKVKFGFKECYYAKITESDGTITYGTPKALKGAVSLTETDADGNITLHIKTNKPRS